MSHIDHLKHMAKVRPDGLDCNAAQWALDEIERLRAALKPFAASAYDRDGLPDDWEIGIPMRQLREARNAIGTEQGRIEP